MSARNLKCDGNENSIKEIVARKGDSLLMENKLKALKSMLHEINDLQAAANVIYWDQTTYMPPGGATAHGHQLATLGRIIQKKMRDPKLGKLLEELEPYGQSLPFESEDASLIRVAWRDHEKARRVPPDFQAQVKAHQSESYQVWAQARPKNNFAAVQPFLEKTLDFSHQYAGYFPEAAHVADPLIERADYGMTVDALRLLFSDLRDQLIPLVQKIGAQQEIDNGPLHQFFPEQEQLDFGQKVIERYGFDFKRGRQDKTLHPYMIRFSGNDVRITTRVDENRFDDALFGTLHEAGHALYELGIDPSLDRTLLAKGTSSGVHESQSRLWENQVGRSRPFWNHFYPQLQSAFPKQLGKTTEDEFYRALNKVIPSLIRVDADEITYNLHVMIRFELEIDLLEGKLAVSDLPEAWHARYESDLGLKAVDDRDGVMQDVHWYDGFIGGQFQGYTLGNIMSALFFEQALKDHPEIPSEITQGRFSTLCDWLGQHVYRHGRKFTADELVQRVTGNPLTIDPYIRYLRKKYGEIYDI